MHDLYTGGTRVGVFNIRKKLIRILMKKNIANIYSDACASMEEGNAVDDYEDDAFNDHTRYNLN